MKHKHKAKRHHHRRRKRGLGFLGIPDTSSPVLTAGAAVGGLLLGSLAGWGVDKFLPPEQYDSIFKKLAKPGAIGTLAGLSLALGKGTRIGKSLALGLGVAAVAAGAKNFLNKDLFGGLGTVTDEQMLGSSENARLIQELQQNFTPSLPALTGSEEYPQFNGADDQVRGTEDEPLRGYAEMQPSMMSGPDDAVIL